MASVLKRGNSFHIMVSLGYDLNGKQIRKTKNWRPPDSMSPSATKKELEKIKVEFEQAVLYGRVLDENITFKNFSDRWLRDYGETQLAPKTYDRYSRMLDDRINPNIGHIKLKNIKPHNLMELYKRLANAIFQFSRGLFENQTWHFYSHEAMFGSLLLKIWHLNLFQSEFLRERLSLLFLFQHRPPVQT